jgi:hypothetical protein
VPDSHVALGDRAVARLGQLVRAAAIQEEAAGATQDREHDVGDERVDVEPQRPAALLRDERADRLRELRDLGLGLAAVHRLVVEPAAQSLEQRPAIGVRDRLRGVLGLGRRSAHRVLFARIGG